MRRLLAGFSSPDIPPTEDERRRHEQRDRERRDLEARARVAEAVAELMLRNRERT